MLIQLEVHQHSGFLPVRVQRGLPQLPHQRQGVRRRGRVCGDAAGLPPELLQRLGVLPVLLQDGVPAGI